jgi:hypothetical protein
VLARAGRDQVGLAMAELDKGKPVSLEERMVSTLAMTDALAELEKDPLSGRRVNWKLLTLTF